MNQTTLRGFPFPNVKNEPTGPLIGDRYLNTETRTIFEYNGKEWFDRGKAWTESYFAFSDNTEQEEVS